MEPVLIGILTAAALAVAAAIVYDRPRRRRSWLDEAVRTRVLIQTRDGTTIEGSIVRVDHDGLVLQPAKFEHQELQGSAWVPRERVAWVQEPETGADRG